MLSLPKHSHTAAMPCNNQFQNSIEIELIDYLFSGSRLGYNCYDRCASSFEVLGLIYPWSTKSWPASMYWERFRDVPWTGQCQAATTGPHHLFPFLFPTRNPLQDHCAGTVPMEQTIWKSWFYSQQIVASVSLITSTSVIFWKWSWWCPFPNKSRFLGPRPRKKNCSNEGQPKKMTITYFISLLTFKFEHDFEEFLL